MSCVRPAPLLSQAFAARAGAPEYSDEPPIINARPNLYLWLLMFRFGRVTSVASVKLTGYDRSVSSTASENSSPYFSPVIIFIPVSYNDTLYRIPSFRDISPSLSVRSFHISEGKAI